MIAICAWFITVGSNFDGLLQRFDAGNSENENGIFLGHLAAFTFKGSYEWNSKNKLLNFEYKQIRLKLGPKWFEFDITPKDPCVPIPDLLDTNVCLACSAYCVLPANDIRQ